MFKKITAIVISVLLLVFVSGCSSNEHDDMIKEAIDLLMDEWANQYDRYGQHEDRVVQIRNTTVLEIKENTREYYQDIAYIINFDLHTNYFDTAPYYFNDSGYNCVIVRTDGTMEVVDRNYVFLVGSRTYNYDISDVAGSMTDYGADYNMERTV